jgi:hypothetical protein
MIVDHYGEKWRKIISEPPYAPSVPFPNPQPLKLPDILPPLPEQGSGDQSRPSENNPVTQEDLDKIRRDIQDLKDLLKRAKEYDEKTGQPDCELDEKKRRLKEIADMVGVDIEFP